MRSMKCIVMIVILGLIISGMVVFEDQSNSNSLHAQAQRNVFEELQRSGTEESSEPIFEGMEIIAQNDILKLYIDKKTTAVAIRDKRTNYVFHTNPEGREIDPLAGGHAKAVMNSQLSISYYNRVGQLFHLNNYSDSIRFNQFEIKEIVDGVRVYYRIGQEERIFTVPLAISKERMEQRILVNLPDADRRMILRNYRLISLASINTEAERNEWLGKYPSLSEHDLYLLSDNLREFQLEQMEELILASGYTVEDMNEDHRINNVPLRKPKLDVFTIPMEYILDGENLLVRIPTEEIEYHETFPLHSIRVLEFFGAADRDAQGYILVPDGSGSLINLNNNKQHHQPFSVEVYGWDMSIPQTELTEITEQAYLPVFGLRKENRAFFAIIEEGEAMARIRADVAGRTNSYNNVFAEFNTIPTDILNLGIMAGRDVVHVHQDRIFEGDIKIRYAFFYDKQASYVGMAHYYQEYLVERFGLERLEPDRSIPFFLEIIGAVNIRRPFLGIPFYRVTALTTYEQSIEIIGSLLNREVENIDVKLSGWFNGGIRHTLPITINHVNAMGGRTGFLKLHNYLEQNEIDFYPDVGLLFVYADRFFDGFNPRTHASRLISRPIARIEEQNLATLERDEELPFKYVLSPSKLSDVVSSVINHFNREHVNGIALRDAGNYVNSDFKGGQLFDRQQASDIIEQCMKDIANSGLSIMVNGGNANILPYISKIVGMPMESNRFDITDHSIPFFQIVIRGFKEFAGSPINLSGNMREELLRAIETGSGIYYKWMYSDNAIVKRTDYDHLFSINFKDWLYEAVNNYHLLNDVLGDVQGQRIIDHQIITSGVHKTTFENGMQIVVNYNKDPFYLMGKRVKGEDFVVLKEAD